jgi:hypothetical protein
VLLPLYNPEQDQTGGMAESALIKTVNGPYDARGSRRQWPTSTVYTVRGVYATPDYEAALLGWVTPADRLISAAGVYLVLRPTGAVDVQAQLDALRAMIGVRGSLLRYPWAATGTAQVVLARLLSVRHTTRRGFADRLVEVEAQFEALAPYWSGAVQTFATSGWGRFDVGGNAPVRDASLAVDGPASQVRVLGPGIDWTWTGTLAAGQQLVVTGVQATAAGAAATLVYNAAHTDETALEFAPGSNTLTVIGGAGWTLTWQDKFA